MSSYPRPDLEALAREQRDEICKLKNEYAHLLFRTQQNRLDTAKCAALQQGMKNIHNLLCRHKGGAKQISGGFVDE